MTARAQYRVFLFRVHVFKGQGKSNDRAGSILIRATLYVSTGISNYDSIVFLDIDASQIGQEG